MCILWGNMTLSTFNFFNKSGVKKHTKNHKNWPYQVAKCTMEQRNWNLWYGVLINKYVWFLVQNPNISQRKLMRWQLLAELVNMNNSKNNKYLLIVIYCIHFYSTCCSPIQSYDDCYHSIVFYLSKDNIVVQSLLWKKSTYRLSHNTEKQDSEGC